MRLRVWDYLAKEHKPQLLLQGHSSHQQQAMDHEPKGMRAPSSLHAARVTGPDRPPSPTTTPRLLFPPCSGTHQKSSARRAQHWELSHAGVRMGHEDRAELFLLEVSRAGTRTNLQAPSSSAILPSPTTTTGAVSVTCACYKTTAKTYTLLQPKARQSPQHPAATPSLATASSAWPWQGQARTFTLPSEQG